MKRGSVDKEFLGHCFGVKITGKHDVGYNIQWLVEDDGRWYPEELSANARWIPDMITVLTEALQWLKANTNYR